MLVHPVSEHLYFLSQFTNNATDEIYAGMIKTDLDLNVQQMASTLADPVNYGHSISDTGDYIYQIYNTIPGYFGEFNATDLTVTRYQYIQNARIINLGSTAAFDGYLFFYARIHSVLPYSA